MGKLHIMPKENYERMRESIQKLLDMFWKDEEKDFETEDETFDEYLVRLKEHVLYDLIVVFHDGDEKNIMVDIRNMYNQEHETEDDEESN